MNIVELFQNTVKRCPDRTALIEKNSNCIRTISFRELQTLAHRAAQRLLESGIGAGDAVLIFHPVSIELYAELIAIFEIRAIAMFLDPSFGMKFVERCCKIFPPKALFAGTKGNLLGLLSNAVRRIPVKLSTGIYLPWTVSWNGNSRSVSDKAIPQTDSDAPALLTFTSGSTGEPKAALRTQNFLWNQHQILMKSLALSEEDVVLSTLPIFVLSHLLSGITSVLPEADLRYPGKIQALPIIQQIENHRVTVLEAPPAFFDRLVHYSETRDVKVPAVSKIFTGGAPVFPRLIDGLCNLAPSAEVQAVYGSTEAEPIAHLSNHEIKSPDRIRMNSGAGLLAGHPIKDIHIAILEDRWGTPIGPYNPSEFGSRKLPSGKIGEITVNGSHVLQGYLHGRGDQETKFKVGDEVWHRTGDAGYFDQEGRLWLVGRCIAKIEDHYGVLYPFTVECAAYQYPEIRRAAFTSQSGLRILVLDFYDSSELPDIARLKKDLSWAHLDGIKFLKEIPVDKRHNSKVDYPELQKVLKKKSSILIAQGKSFS